MTYSVACVELVKRFEGLRLEAYSCPAGIPTIGYGHTSGVKMGDCITQEQAEAMLRADLDDTADSLSRVLPAYVVLPQCEFDALTSLCFNMRGGAAALPRKAPTLWRYLMAGERPEAAAQFLDIDHALVNGKPTVLPGLRARREAESAIFLGQVTQPT